MPAKKSSRPKAPPDLPQLVAHLRHVADRLEADLPLLDVRKLAPMVEPLHTITTAFLTVEGIALTVPRDDYLSVRQSWLEAWAIRPDVMQELVASTLPGKLPPHHAREDVMLWRLRVLVQTIQQLGVATAAGLARRALAPAPSEASGMKVDREANATLRTWGGWPLDDFLAQWSHIKPGMLKRACTVLGIQVTNRWTLPQKTDLHRRAQRFARNTVL